MSLPSAVRVRFEEVRVLAFGLVLPAYTMVGLPFEHPIRLLKILNATDADVVISYDGVTDHDVIPALGFCLYDFASNKSSVGGHLEMPIGGAVYARQLAAPGTLGAVAVVCMYASNA